jgi:hypothetical protein
VLIGGIYEVRMLLERIGADFVLLPNTPTRGSPLREERNAPIGDELRCGAEPCS